MEYIVEKLTWAWNDLNFIIAGAVFVAYFIYDVLYTSFTLSVTGLKAGRAATISSMLYVIGTVGVLSYVENFLYTIPIIIGGWFGTYITVRREKMKKDGEICLQKVPYNK